MFIDLERGREGESERGLHTCPDQRLNLQPRYVSSPGTELATFWCTKRCSNQMSHLAGARAHIISQAVSLLLLLWDPQQCGYALRCSMARRHRRLGTQSNGEGPTHLSGTYNAYADEHFTHVQPCNPLHNPNLTTWLCEHGPSEKAWPRFTQLVA